MKTSARRADVTTIMHVRACTSGGGPFENDFHPKRTRGRSRTRDIRSSGRSVVRTHVAPVVCVRARTSSRAITTLPSPRFRPGRRSTVYVTIAVRLSFDGLRRLSSRLLGRPCWRSARRDHSVRSRKPAVHVKRGPKRPRPLFGGSRFSHLGAASTRRNRLSFTPWSTHSGVFWAFSWRGCPTFSGTFVQN